MKRIGSRQFNQDVGSAKRAANDGPVLITDRGKPAYVLMTAEAYQGLRGQRASAGELFANLPDTCNVDIEFEQRATNSFKAAELRN